MTRYGTFLFTVAIVLAGAILLAGCTGTPPVSHGEEIRQFGSADEIREYIRENTAKASEYGHGMTGGAVRNAEEAIAVPAAVPQGAMKTAADTAGAAAGTAYSTTNVQVAGVDEPDFVKNDGRYVYIISGNALVIVDAYPPENAVILSETEIGDTVQEIFVTGDRLVLFSTGTGDDETIAATRASEPAGKAIAMPRYYRTEPVTHATVYTIADRKNPTVIKDYTIDGSYVDARMISGIVYLLTRENIYSYDDIVVPVVREGGRTIAEPAVYYFDNPESNYAFTTVTAFDAATGAEKDAKTFLMGSGNTLYVSHNAMYVSYQKWYPVYRTYAGTKQAGIVDDITGISGGSSSSPAILFEEFNRLSESEKQEIIAEMKSDEEDRAAGREYDQTTTVIHKIAIRDGTIAYVARGEIAGSLNNQFAMDEYDGNLRAATTSSVSTRQGQYEYNNVFVLDAGMKAVGSLTHIAEQETIYSTRFIGDRLYMVTFKRIDPFFVIDLSDPAKPKILGKLKIPGYSDYLHPYDSSHIIGVGKETATNDWGGVSTRGVKIALFDVTDVENPKQVDKVEIGEAGTDSAALYDHKAFLFDRGKNLLVLPIRQVTTTGVAEKPGYYDSGQRVWYGAYVFGVTPQTGFVLRGTVQHGTASSGYYWYGSSRDEVKRALYIENDLYTISASKIVATDLNDVRTAVKTVGLPGGPDYPDVPGRVLE